MIIFFQQDAPSDCGLEDGILSKAKTINYDEQLRRVLRDTPSPEELSDEEEFTMPPESPPTPEPPKTKIPALTATEYFGVRSPLRSPLPLSRKDSSLSSQTNLTHDEPE